MQTLRQALLVLLLAIGTGAAAQRSIYVDSSISSSGTGSSWSAAYKTLNEALATANAASAVTSYQILVARGTYYPTRVQSDTVRDSTFYLARGNVRIFGGYPSGGGTRAISGNPTILSGDIGTKDDTADNSYHVMVIAGLQLTDTVVLSGLTFTRGNASGSGIQPIGSSALPRFMGGGLAMFRSRSQFFIDSCSFISNAASNGTNMSAGGGVIYLNDPPNTSVRPMLKMRDCLIARNTSFNGGGMSISVDGAIDSIINCRFLDNRARTGGGLSASTQSTRPDSSNMYMEGCTFSGNNECGIFMYTMTSFTGGPARSVINRCVISDNTETGARFHVFADAPGDANCDIIDCVFRGNNSLLGAGGVDTRIGSVNSAANLRFANCTIADNISQGAAGGMHNSMDSSPQNHLFISGCTISGNYSPADGGGMHNSNYIIGAATGIIVDSCIIINNRSDQTGGGLYNSRNSVDVRRTVISGNQSGSGGGISNDNCNPAFNSCLISGNRATSGAGGALRNYCASPNVVNCTLAGDTAKAGGAAMYNDGTAPSFSRPVVTNTIIWEGDSSILDANPSNLAAITYSTVQGGFGGTGNNSTIPAFINPLAQSAAPSSGGNYRLPSCSPLNNTGTNSSAYTNLKDLVGNPRVYDIIDRGAYEFPDLYPSVIRGDTNLCIGQSQQYTNLIPGGTWSNRNSAVAAISAAGVLTTLSAGYDTIDYAAPAVATCAAHVSSKTVLIHPDPVVAAITGKDTICVDGAAQLNVATPGGIWVSSNPAIALVSNSGLISAISAGVDTIRYIVTNTGGCSSTAEHIIIILPLPAIGPITGPDHLCGIGSQAQMGSTTAGGVWSSSDTSVARIDGAGLIEAVSSGHALLRYVITSAEGCISDTTQSVRVVIIDKDVTGSGMILTAAMADTLASYAWYSCDSLVELGNEPVFDAPRGGAYKVVIKLLGCSDTSECIPVVANAVAGHSAADAIRVYPNPASGNIFVDSDAPLDGAMIRIKDVTGKSLLEIRVTGTGPVQFPLGDVATGMYFIEIELGMSKTTRRISIAD